MAATDRGRMPLVSFVIPVKNDAARLEKCLESIRANSYPTDRVEIVVVDNGSVDASVAVAQRYGARVLTKTEGRLGDLRNAGVQHSTGEILGFVDADHEIVPGWVAAAAETLTAGRAVAVGAACSPPPDGTWVQLTYDRLRQHREGIWPVSWLGSGNLAVTRAAFLGVSGFDTSLETCEDVDLCRKLLLAGGQILADSRLGNVHLGDPRTLSHVFRGERWRGRDNVRVSFRPPRSWRGLASALVPTAWLLLLAVAVAGLLTGSRAGLRVGLAALLAAAGLIVARTIRMLASGGGWTDLVRAFLVACAYDFGRAFALVGRTSYSRRRQEATR